jgi:hypothetical protein
MRSFWLALFRLSSDALGGILRASPMRRVVGRLLRREAFDLVETSVGSFDACACSSLRQRWFRNWKNEAVAEAGADKVLAIL